MTAGGLSGVGAAGATLLRDYAAPPGVFDELLGRDGAPLPHWRPLVRAFQDLGADGLAVRWQHARHFVRDNGITYNVYGDPRGMDRPWPLDVVPVIVAADDWQRLAAGLEQRATLCNLILADLYGPQRLLRDGHLPPEMVFAHPGFLRPCHGIVPPERRYLHLYAADLARTADGSWCVLGDRTQAPSGSGYALENRLALGRSFSELLRECGVAPLAGFFAALRATLVRHAARHSDHPRIVLLTPGAHNETYFEHAYLARYLGFELAEGGDLTVRDGIVYVKTLEGLQRVDVILRRLDDDFCDPLSLRSDSALGVPGLVHAVRRGSVVVANALGSGLVESPALLAFLPGLCRRLLGESLLLPSVPTWWCGEPSALAYVEAHLDRLVVKPAFPGTPVPLESGSGGTDATRTAMLAAMRARPYAYAAQERIAFSTAPAWADGTLQPRPVSLRAFCAAAPHGYSVLPGGLTRVAAVRDAPVVSMQHGGSSKDTWVLADGPLSGWSLARESAHTVELTRGGDELSSRVADNLFWLGRYLARGEAMLRLLRALLRRCASETEPSTGPGMSALLDGLAAALGAGRVDLGAVGGGAADVERAVRALAAAAEPERGIHATLGAAGRLAAVVRDRISPDTWRVVRELERGIGTLRAAADAGVAELLAAVNGLVLTCAAFDGVAIDRMTRTHAWRFTDIGRRSERVLSLVHLLRVTVVRPHTDEAGVLDAVLDVADAAITYRRRYLGTVLAEPVLDLLVLDETNPRAVVFELACLDEHMRQLPRGRTMAVRSDEERLAAGMLARVRLADVSRLCVIGADGTRGGLDALLGGVLTDLPALADVLTRRYLTHTPIPHRLDEG
jgi:uncharacterized circularly permuted ATP-grasp superfamily protein/uncharacterized alpha-E superfamily protein